MINVKVNLDQKKLLLIIKRKDNVLFVKLHAITSIKSLILNDLDFVSKLCQDVI